MKKQILLVSGLILVVLAVSFSCNRKKSSGIAPTYGSTGNPNPNNPTVTGNVTAVNPATENTSIFIGGNGWNNPTCGSTNGIALKGYNGTVDVTMTFNSTITSGTFVVSPSPGPGACALSILNAPGQPAGIVWQGKSGTVVVNTTTNSTNASFSGVVCTQASFNFPAVTASGFLGCSK